MINNWNFTVATVNGSGSQSANQILLRSFFRLGLAASGKNLFPSNIQGLPTWFSIRVSPEGFMGRKEMADFFVGMNLNSLEEDQTKIKPGGHLFYNEEFAGKFNPRSDIELHSIPFRDLVKDTSSSVKMRKLLTNMVYVGLLADVLGVDSETVKGAIATQFNGKDSAIEPNFKAFQAGLKYADETGLKEKFPYRVQALPERNKHKVLIDGNSASALGLCFGGCQFLAWYPITPSSSLAESLISYGDELRLDSSGQPTMASIQAEDELSAINMVLGAGWAGARAVTATSGPGVSLMAEAAGLSYFAEIPAVIWDVQRAGPSTGLPTRTMQGDIKFASGLSHGDTEHVLLFPNSPKECFEFGQLALDLAEELQSLIFVMTDLDLGMNLWVDDEFSAPTHPPKRGKVLTAEDLNELEHFARYEDRDGDGVPYRTLPGTKHMNAAYFTRGTGHQENAGYSEDPKVFQKLLDRLKKKMDTAKNLVPAPLIDENPAAQIGLLAFGSTDLIMPETRSLLKNSGVESSYLRLRAWPPTLEVKTFLKKYPRTYIIEQNRDGQLRSMLCEHFDLEHDKLKSSLSYDGLPPCADTVALNILDSERGL